MPGLADMSADMSAAPDMSPADPLFACDGLDGEACALPHAVGVCIGRACTFLACEGGFRDCDGQRATGCEQDITAPTSCGSCQTQCRDGERCQAGPRGYLCSSAIVCEPDAFDLDRDPDNGCEWSISQVEQTPLQPIFALDPILRIEVNDEVQAAVGLDAEQRPLLATSFDEAGLGTLIPEPDARTQLAPPLKMRLEPGTAQELSLLIFWEDALTYHVRSPEQVASDALLQHPCVPGEGELPEQVTGGAWFERSSFGAAATLTSNLVPLSSCQESGLCFEEARAFGPADYIRMFYPYEDRTQLSSPSVIAAQAWAFAPAEVSTCSPCVVDMQTGRFIEDRRCWGRAQCTPEGFERATACPTCEAAASQGCPLFEPMDVIHEPASQQTFIITRRGVVVVADVGGLWRPVARLEETFDASVFGGGRFVSADVVRVDELTTRVFLLHNAGFVRVVELEQREGEVLARQLGADLGVVPGDDARGDLRLSAIDAQTFILTGDTEARVVRLGETSARNASLLVEGNRGLDGYFGARPAPGGATLWRIRGGNLERVTLTH